MTQIAYSLKQAAALSSLSVRSLRYLITSGKLSYAKVGRRIVIPHVALEQMLRRATVKATEPLDADEPIRPRETREDPDDTHKITPKKKTPRRQARGNNNLSDAPERMRNAYLLVYHTRHHRNRKNHPQDQP
jgi:hypothetical protein